MQGKKVIVAGAGKSGIASSGLLIRNHANVILYDGNEKLDREELLRNFETPNFDVRLGELTDDILEGADLFVISPGIPVDAPFVNKVRDKGIPIWGEIELAYYFNKGVIAAITGTNGKTTTTTLVGEIFKNYTDDYLVVGNIGLPFTRFADSTTENTLVAAEISSFQLETIHEFRPHVSAVLNLTPEHLNRHYTFDNYVNAKFRITENQTESDFVVLNYDDPELRAREGAITGVKKIYFSHEIEPDEGAFARDGKIYIKEAGGEEEILDIDKIQILGQHNLENVLAAVTIAYYMKVPVDVIRETVYAFKGVEHRIEYVREVNEVKYYNDSKGTNPDAAIKAVQAMNRKTVLIGGGYDKQNEYDEWIESFGDKITYLILIGQTKEKIADCAKKHGFNNIIMCETFEEAMEEAKNHAKEGQAVLLSPACASWGMFKNYEERGKIFKDIVRAMEE